MSQQLQLVCWCAFVVHERPPSDTILSSGENRRKNGWNQILCVCVCVGCTAQYQMNSETDTIGPAKKPVPETDEANGDDNYAIISFIFVGTSSFPILIHCATASSTVHIMTFPIRRRIPNCLLDHIAIAMARWCCCCCCYFDCFVIRRYGKWKKQHKKKLKKAKKTKFVSANFILSCELVPVQRRIIIMSKIVIEQTEWTNAKP